jgi:MFS family permease
MSASSSRQRPVLLLFFILLAQLSIVASIASINLTLPELQDALGASANQLQWMVLTEQLAYAVLLIVGGRLGDMFGRRRLYLIGLVMFTLASLTAATAQTAEMVIGARLLQPGCCKASPEVSAPHRCSRSSARRSTASAATVPMRPSPSWAVWASRSVS